MKFRVRKL